MKNKIHGGVFFFELSHNVFIIYIIYIILFIIIIERKPTDSIINTEEKNIKNIITIKLLTQNLTQNEKRSSQRNFTYL
jgi:hypothetical protein